MTGVLPAAPIVVVTVVTVVHVPLVVPISAVLVVVGLAFMAWCAVRFQRTFAYRWVLLLMAAGLVVALSAIVVVAYFVRTLA